MRITVVKKLDILVAADPSSQSGKAQKARTQGTRIMLEPAFWQAIWSTPLPEPELREWLKRYPTAPRP